MEIKFENKELSSFREISRQLKRIQESAESVVPDTNEDIGSVASVHTSVLLKSKDINGNTARVSGEAEAVLLYITEGENKVSYLRLTKSFFIDFDADDTDAIPQVKLKVINSEARVINPRKVSVTMEIAGELSCYMPELVAVDARLPENTKAALHTEYKNEAVLLPNAVCEKTFAINEQFSFPQGKPLPSKLVYEKPTICIDETEQIGSRLIIKGTLNMEVCYLSDEVSYPLTKKFSAAFSQLIDTGQEAMDSCTVLTELTSVYYELVDTINGDKALNAEIHGVAQVVSRERQSISYISDAYSNLMPSVCSIKPLRLTEVTAMLKNSLEGEKQIEISDDCEDVLCVISSLGQSAAAQGGLTAPLYFDIIYMTACGSLSAVRRLVTQEAECPEAGARLTGAYLSSMNFTCEGKTLSCRYKLELFWQSSFQREINRVSELELKEEMSYDLSKFPTISLVRQENESIWELAKSYHSDVKSIETMNNWEEEKGSLLIIPREI